MLDDDVEAAAARLARAGRDDTRVVPADASEAQHLEPVAAFALGRSGEPDSRLCQLEAHRRHAPRDLRDVHLGAAGGRVARVPLVQDQDAAGSRHPVRGGCSASAMRSHQTIQNASRAIRSVSFEVPRVRSRKKNWISFTRAWCFMKR